MSRLSFLSLIAANLFAGSWALVYGSGIYDLILIFWVENVVIGILNVFKMALSQAQGISNLEEVRSALKKGTRIRPVLSGPPTLREKIPGMLFFCVHYFAFCIAHLAAINHTFSDEQHASPGITWIYVPPIAALFISHTISFFKNYIGKKEYLEKVLPELVSAPYYRVLFVHAFVFLGAWLIANYSNADILLLAIFILVKIIIDLLRHLAEHRPGNAAVVDATTKRSKENFQ